LYRLFSRVTCAGVHAGHTRSHDLSVGECHDDDVGDIAPAAATGMMTFYSNVVARLVHAVVSRYVLGRTQGWRQR